MCFVARCMEISMYLTQSVIARYMVISMYLAICFVKEKNWQRLPELLINLPIVFKIGKINKIRVVSCQEKAASYMLLTKNGRLGLLFTIFDAFLAKNAFLKLILATRSWQKC